MLCGGVGFHHPSLHSQTNERLIDLSRDPWEITMSPYCLCSLPIQIVDEHTVQAKLDVLSSKTFVLKADWFWYTIQNGYADESDYLFGDVSSSK